MLFLKSSTTLKRSDEHVALSDISICNIKENMKQSNKNNWFKMSAPTWNEEFELPDGSYFVSDIEDYFEYIIK